MKHSLSVIALLLVLCSNLSAQWTVPNAPPTGGLISSLVRDEVTGALYSGTSNALFKSINDGTSWSRISIDPTYENNSVTSVLYAEGDEVFVIYPGVNKIYKSTNGGVTWTTITLPANEAPKSMVKSTSGSGLYMNTNNFIYNSIDGGSTWTAISSGFSGINKICYSGLRIFAATSNGVYRWETMLGTWTQVNNGLTTTQAKFTLDIEALGSSIYVSSNAGVYRTDNLGDAWYGTNLSYSQGNLTIYNNELYSPASNTSLFKYSPGSNLWTNSTNITSNGGEFITCYVFYNNTVFFGTNGLGVFKNTIGSAAVAQPINTGLYGGNLLKSITEINGKLIAGLDKVGISISSDGGNTWTESNSGLPTNKYIEDVFVDGSTVYTSILGLSYRSFDEGQTWSVFGTGLPANYLGKFVKVGSDLYACGYGAVFKYSSGSNAWTYVGTGLPLGYVQDITTDGTSLYCFLNSNAIFKINPSTESAWQSIPTGLPTSGYQAIEYANGFVFLLTSSNGVYRSSNQGASWVLAGLTGISGYSILKTPANELYVGGSQGKVYKSIDNGTCWLTPSSVAAIPTSAQIYTLGYHASSNTLLAAPQTFGGLFLRNGNQFPTSINLNSTISGTSLVCEGQSFINYTATFHSGSTYGWTVPPGFTITNGANTASIYVTAGATSGDVTLTETKAGCSSPTVTKAVTVTPKIAADAITGITTVCRGASFAYSVPQVAGTSYSWSLPGGMSFEQGQGTHSISVFVGAAFNGGSIQVFATRNGCTSDVSKAISVSAPIVATTLPVRTLCEATITQFTGNTANASSYVWTAPSDVTLPLNSNSASIQATIGANSGTMELKSFDGNNCLVENSFFPFNVIAPIAVAPTITGLTNVCPNQVGISYSVVLNGSNTYTWTIPNGAVLSSNNGNSITVDFLNFVNGTISVEESDGACSSISSSLALSSTLDSDGDGLPDCQELALGTNPDYADTDGDGILDGTDGIVDSDGDSYINALDPDSDNDGIIDSTEGLFNTDGDLLPNYLDLDSDADGKTDATEGTGDIDGDGIANYVDPSECNPFAAEPLSGSSLVCSGSTYIYSIPGINAATSNYTWTIPSGMTVISSTANSYTVSLNGFTTGTISVSEVNGQGCISTPSSLVVSIDVSDADGDGVSNCQELILGTDPASTDTDGDGILDNTDGFLDIDGDGFINALDADSDGDGILDATEGIVDTDGDGKGNYVDLDSDDDRILDSVEGTGDLDGDGIPNYIDPCAMPSSFAISGLTNVCPFQTMVAYSAPALQGGTFNWFLPQGASIVSGAGTNSIVVNFGAAINSITVAFNSQCATRLETLLLTGSGGYAIGSTSATCGGAATLCVPIKRTTPISNGIIGLDFEVGYDASVLIPTGTATLGTVATTYATYVLNTSTTGKVVGSVYLNGAPANTYFSGTGDVICLNFTVKSTALPGVTPLTVTNIIESKVLSSNSVCNGTPGTFTFIRPLKGQLIYRNNTATTKRIGTISGTTTSTAFTTTDASCSTVGTPSSNLNSVGQFSVDMTGASSIIIDRDIIGDVSVPALSCASVQSVIGATDRNMAAQISSSVIASPTVYELLSADVNLDGKVTAGDATLISQRSINAYNCEFPQVSNYTWDGTNLVPSATYTKSKDWLFIDNTVLSNPAFTAGMSKNAVPKVPACLPVSLLSPTCTTTTDVTYQGILLGDVNGSWISANNSTMKSAPEHTLVIDLSKTIDLGSNVYEVPLSYQSAEPFYGLDVEMDYNEQAIRVSSVEKNASFAGVGVDYNNIASSKLMFTSYEATGLKTASPILYLTLQTNGGKPTEADFGDVKAFYNESLANVRFNNGTINSTADAVVPSVSVYPNPVQDVLTIEGLTSGSSLQIVNLLGTEVYNNSNTVKEINVSELAAGVYFLKVHTEKGDATIRFTKVK